MNKKSRPRRCKAARRRADGSEATADVPPSRFALSLSPSSPPPGYCVPLGQPRARALLSRSLPVLCMPTLLRVFPFLWPPSSVKMCQECFFFGSPMCRNSWPWGQVQCTLVLGLLLQLGYCLSPPGFGTRLSHRVPQCGFITQKWANSFFSFFSRKSGT